MERGATATASPQADMIAASPQVALLEDKIQAPLRAGGDEALLRNLDHSLVDEVWQSLRRRNGCNDG